MPSNKSRKLKRAAASVTASIVAPVVATPVKKEVATLPPKAPTAEPVAASVPESESESEEESEEEESEDEEDVPLVPAKQATVQATTIEESDDGSDTEDSGEEELESDEEEEEDEEGEDEEEEEESESEAEESDQEPDQTVPAPTVQQVADIDDDSESESEEEVDEDEIDLEQEHEQHIQVDHDESDLEVSEVSDIDDDNSDADESVEESEDELDEDEIDHKQDHHVEDDESEVNSNASRTIESDEEEEDEVEEEVEEAVAGEVDELDQETAVDMTEADIIASHNTALSLTDSDASAVTSSETTAIDVKSARDYADRVKNLTASRLSSVELSTLATDLSERALSPVREAYSREPSPVRATLEPEVHEVEGEAVAEEEEEEEEEEAINSQVDMPEDSIVEEPSLLLPGIDAQAWISVLFLLEGEADIVMLGSTCKALKRLILDPAVIASWLLRRSTHYLCLYNTYKSLPHLLTPPVAQTLISQGAHIPRHLASLIAQENPYIIDTSTPYEKTPLSEALDLLVWTGKTTYGDMFGFDAETAVNATLVPGQEAPEVINAKISQYRKVLGWAYKGVVEERMTAAGQDYDEDKKGRKSVMKSVTDGDAFIYLLKMYNHTFEVEDKVVLDIKKPLGRGRFTGIEDKRLLLKDDNISEQEKQRNKIAAALRELSNIYRFAPGLVADRLEVGWLPVDLFERDVELAWFLLRHAGDARQRVVADASGLDDVTYKTLLGYRVHINANASTLPGSVTDVIPFPAINRLIVQGNIVLSDQVLIRMLGKFTNQTTVDRLARFVPRARLALVGEYLLQECFEKPALESAISSGYINKPIQRAETLVKIFTLDKDAISRSFMGQPKDWDNWNPPHAPQTTSTISKGTPSLNKDDGLYQYDIGMLTRPAQAIGSLPWVFWQWAVEKLGPKHPVASACLHDVTVRTFTDQAPLNPGSHDHISFPRKEADASVKALLALGVPASMATLSTSVRKALYEVEVAALSGEAAAAMRSQAASLKGKKGKMAAAVAEAASLAGANAISRRYIYVLMDVEKRLLTMSSDYSATVKVEKDTASVSSAKTSITSGPRETLETNLFVETNVEVAHESGITMERKVLALYPQALLNQPRSLWLLAMQALATNNATWKGLIENPVTPNSCRRFCMAASNICRGLEQFGNAATALAVLKSKKGSQKQMKSMSSSDSEATMFYGLWVKEIEAEDAEKDRIKRGL
ncbi:hypothetical protein BC830DRAFT_524024 [Chytriomyces sp. MP71]|nr:hypothetical protein BC830DRAFT_524024 [Chytriomyces sp. MP71]